MQVISSWNMSVSATSAQKCHSIVTYYGPFLGVFYAQESALQEVAWRNAESAATMATSAKSRTTQVRYGLAHRMDWQNTLVGRNLQIIQN